MLECLMQGFKQEIEKIAIPMRLGAPFPRVMPKVLKSIKYTKPTSGMTGKQLYGEIKQTPLWKEKQLAEKERLSKIWV